MNNRQESRVKIASRPEHSANSVMFLNSRMATRGRGEEEKSDDPPTYLFCLGAVPGGVQGLLLAWVTLSGAPGTVWYQGFNPGLP